MKSMFVCLTFFALLSLVQAGMVKSLKRTDVKSSDCEACNTIMEFIRSQAVDQAQPALVIREKLKVLKKIFPSTFQVELYLANIEDYVKMIREGNHPLLICRLLAKCAADSIAKPRDAACAVCTAVVDLIKLDITLGNFTLQIIVAGVKALCAILGDVPVYEECKIIVDAINKIIQWLEEKLTPTDICKRLGFCTNTTVTGYPNFDVGAIVPEKGASKALCNICAMVAGKMSNMLEGLEKRVDDVERELTVKCRGMGENSEQCQLYVGFIFDAIKKKVKFIGTLLKSSATCQKLQFCLR